MPTIPIKVKHIQQSKGYGSNTNCSLANAAKEYFNTKNVRAGYVTVGVNEEDIRINYGMDLYDMDEMKVRYMQNPDPELVVRELEYELV